MIKIVKQNEQGSSYGQYYYVCDSEEDLKKVPTKTPSMGSRLYVINTQKEYILNGNQEWVEYVSNTGSSTVVCKGEDEPWYDIG